MEDDLDDAEERAWCAGQRRQVLDYLARENLIHGGVGEGPAWHVAPYVAVWAIESLKRPGNVGWWAISGDLPTDFVSCGGERTPRGALRAFASIWQEAAHAMADGRSLPEHRVGHPAQQASLAPLLASRAKCLQEWAEDDEIWIE